MTSTAAPTVKDQELILRELVESESVNSLPDFFSSNLNEMEANKENDINDFINNFICHLIFYAVFCITLVFHIFVDLGLGSLVKNQFLQFIEISRNFFVEKKTAFA
tara:strand:+ start:174 stop:491 length:318 start_codon:yes stop_codon:yes gene_type:complete